MVLMERGGGGIGKHRVSKRRDHKQNRAIETVWHTTGSSPSGAELNFGGINSSMLCPIKKCRYVNKAYLFRSLMND